VHGDRLITLERVNIGSVRGPDVTLQCLSIEFSIRVIWPISSRPLANTIEFRDLWRSRCIGSCALAYSLEPFEDILASENGPSEAAIRA